MREWKWWYLVTFGTIRGSLISFTPRKLYPRRDPRIGRWIGLRIGKEKSVIPPGIEHRFPWRPTRKNGRTGTTFRLPLSPFLPVHVPHQECSISRPSTDRSSGTRSPNSLRRHAVTRSSGEAILIRVTAAVSGKEGACLHRPEGSASNPGLPF
jgi:hypothetical protein